jgi:hypothetical protein
MVYDRVRSSVGGGTFIRILPAKTGANSSSIVRQVFFARGWVFARIVQFSRPRNFCVFSSNYVLVSENKRHSQGLLHTWSAVFVLQISSKPVGRAFGDDIQTRQNTKNVRNVPFSRHHNFCVFGSNQDFLSENERKSQGLSRTSKVVRCDKYLANHWVVRLLMT